MVDYIYEKLKTKKDQKQIVRDLLEDIISPDYAQTSKLFCDFDELLTMNLLYRWSWMRQHDLRADRIQEVMDEATIIRTMIMNPLKSYFSENINRLELY